MPDQKCTGTARIYVVMGSTSLLPIYATAADFLYRLSASGKVVMMWTYMDCILKEKRSGENSGQAYAEENYFYGEKNC